MTSRNLAIAAALGLMISACDALPEEEHAVDRAREPATASTVPTPQPADTRAEPAGEPVTIEIAADDELQWAASVMQIHPMESQNAKLFGVSGGDPAMNGLVTYLGLFAGPAEGWRVYRIGDFEEWTVSEESRRRVVLDARESRMGEDGDIVTEDRRLIVEFRMGEDGGADRVTVTPAR
ncbi:hypothetical protein [Brevundimonas denitrificans]|jgi:hypothetical protein|uniref:hypothetical protein n=1 Tax=Brevundimonas denitrificans TaxID=1443434 RepID=UPI00223AA354|nr:hypothetical protein [Brevundimonas denitrificans]